jgi:hypothetical protein
MYPEELDSEWPEEQPKKRHLWIYGPSNCGKSTWVKKNFKHNKTYVVPYATPENWVKYQPC